MNRLPVGARGKRRLANIMYFFLVILTALGFFFPLAWVMAQFYTPYIVSMGVALYGLDAYYTNPSTTDKL